MVNSDLRRRRKTTHLSDVWQWHVLRGAGCLHLGLAAVEERSQVGQVLRNVAIVSYNSQKVVNTTSDGVIELKLRPGAKLVVTYLISNK